MRGHVPAWLQNRQSFLATGDINPDNDCQWCQASVDRFAWTVLAAATVCGNQTDDECTNPDTCDGAGTCLANDEAVTTTCGDDGTECTKQDYCNGIGGCTDNGHVEVDAPCGDATFDECTNPDTCDGAGACLDNHEPTTTTCGDDGTECTKQDYCNGIGGRTDNGYVDADTPCGSDSDTECDNPDTCNGLGTCGSNQEPSGETVTCGDTEQPCTYQDYCDGNGGCQDRGFKPATTTCTGNANGGACDKDATDHCSGTDNTCVDTFQPSSYVCEPETAPNGAYRCMEAVRCSGTNSACRLPDIISYDPNRVCRPSVAPCDPEEYCSGPQACSPDVRWSIGQECPGAADCELPYSCDASGNCNSNGNRSDTASCRAPANDCDLRDICGDPFAAGDPRNRTNFDDYPECGPDIKKPDGDSCTNGAFAGTRFSGECITISNCRYNIDCPDGYVCNNGECAAVSVDHGYGDDCVGKRVCDQNSVDPGAICTFSVDCRDAAHPGGNCVPGIFGDCGSDGRGPLVCCAGMGADGIGFAAAPGQKGRCQQCCATDYFDVTVTGCGEFDCCDGKCTDILTDPHNCGGCAHNGGVECDNLVNACSPAVLGCEEGTRGSECIMQNACLARTIRLPCTLRAACRTPNWFPTPCAITAIFSAPPPISAARPMPTVGAYLEAATTLLDDARWIRRTLTPNARLTANARTRLIPTESAGLPLAPALFSISPQVLALQMAIR